jgi:hypothetical protein
MQKGDKMIVFEFTDETHNNDGSLKPRPVYWLGATFMTGTDKAHEDEIYEQLEANQVFNS